MERRGALWGNMGHPFALFSMWGIGQQIPMLGNKYTTNICKKGQ